MKQRLQKLMARAGIASRRGSEEMIKDGRVQVNGEVAVIGQQADAEVDQILVDGQPIQAPENPIVIMLNKPAGVLSSRRSQGGKRRVIDIVQTDERVYPVGRLDLESEGLILLTNDGDLAHRLTHPRYGHRKRYRVKLDGPLTIAQQNAWQNGPRLDDLGRLSPCKLIPDPKPGWYEVSMAEGRKRQIRRTAEHFGRTVRRLIRVEMGPLELGELETGAWRVLSHAEWRDLRLAVGLPVDEVYGT